MKTENPSTIQQLGVNPNAKPPRNRRNKTTTSYQMGSSRQRPGLKLAFTCEKKLIPYARSAIGEMFTWSSGELPEAVHHAKSVPSKFRVEFEFPRPAQFKNEALSLLPPHVWDENRFSPFDAIDSASLIDDMKNTNACILTVSHVSNVLQDRMEMRMAALNAAARRHQIVLVLCMEYQDDFRIPVWNYPTFDVRNCKADSGEEAALRIRFYDAAHSSSGYTLDVFAVAHEDDDGWDFSPYVSKNGLDRCVWRLACEGLSPHAIAERTHTDKALVVERLRAMPPLQAPWWP